MTQQGSDDEFYYVDGGRIERGTRSRWRGDGFAVRRALTLGGIARGGLGKGSHYVWCVESGRERQNDRLRIFALFGGWEGPATNSGKDLRIRKGRMCKQTGVVIEAFLGSQTGLGKNSPFTFVRHPDPRHEREMGGIAGTDNTARRKWDKDEYAARAKERERLEDEKEKGKNIRPPPGAIIERKTLNLQSIIQRDYKKELEARVGTKTIVNLDTGEGLGFKCQETGVILRDSIAYLDHINGKKQQKALGMSMRVERSTVEQVRGAFDRVKRKKEDDDKESAEDFAKRVKAAEEDEEELKARRAEKKKAKKEAKRLEEEKAKAQTEAEFGLDPDMAAMMGFSGFGGPN